MRASLARALLPLLLPLGGCGLFSKPEEQPVQEVKTREAPGRPEMTVGELDHLTRNYADRLVARISTACDRIKRESPEDEERQKAHQLKLSVALGAYDIVTSSGGSAQLPGAAQHAIDLAILTELHAIRWIDEKSAREEFGKSGEMLAEALAKARDDIWPIVARIMAPEQLDQLKTMILHWRQQNPAVEWLARVRFDVIAQGKEGAGFSKSVGEGFNPLQPVVRAVDETRILAQQALYYAKRMPTILDWTVEATVSDTLAVPKLDALVRSLTETLGSVARATATLERLTEPSSQEPAVNSTIQEVKESLVQAKELVREVRGLESAVEPLLDKPGKATTSGKPLDLEAVASKVDEAARGATSLVRETRGLAESPSAVRNVDELLGRATRSLSATGRKVIDHAAWRAVEIVILIALLVALVKAAVFLFKKRRVRPTGD